MLSDEQITKFQELYKNHFGKDISRNEAYEQGVKLIRLIQFVYKSEIEKEHKEIQKSHKEK